MHGAQRRRRPGGSGRSDIDTPRESKRESKWTLRTGRVRVAVGMDKGGAGTIFASVIDYSGGEFSPSKSALVRAGFGR